MSFSDPTLTSVLFFCAIAVALFILLNLGIASYRKFIASKEGKKTIISLSYEHVVRADDASAELEFDYVGLNKPEQTYKLKLPFSVKPGDIFEVVIEDGARYCRPFFPLLIVNDDKVIPQPHILKMS